MLDDALSERSKAQLACEVIFLTHNEALHGVNLRWHPQAEELLWTPRLQEAKTSENGAANVRYRRGKKGKMVSIFKGLALRAPAVLPRALRLLNALDLTQAVRRFAIVERLETSVG